MSVTEPQTEPIVTTEPLPDYESIYGHREVNAPRSGRRRSLDANGNPEYTMFYYKPCKRARCQEYVRCYKVEGVVYYTSRTPVITEAKAEHPFCSWKCAGLWAAKQSRDTES